MCCPSATTRPPASACKNGSSRHQPIHFSPRGRPPLPSSRHRSCRHRRPRATSSATSASQLAVLRTSARGRESHSIGASGEAPSRGGSSSALPEHESSRKGRQPGAQWRLLLLGKEHSWRTAWRARSLLSRTTTRSHHGAVGAIATRDCASSRRIARAIACAFEAVAPLAAVILQQALSPAGEREASRVGRVVAARDTCGMTLWLMTAAGFVVGVVAAHAVTVRRYSPSHVVGEVSVASRGLFFSRTPDGIWWRVRLRARRCTDDLSG
jgi:hypothetical protein